MESKVFCLCENLKKVVFQEGSKLRRIGEFCFCGSGLEEFTPPPVLKEISGGAFKHCQSLRRVILNEGLETLEDQYDSMTRKYYGVFQYSEITEVTLPSTLKEIGSRTFKDCKSLNTIRVKRSCYADFSKLDMPSSVKIVRQWDDDVS